MNDFVYLFSTTCPRCNRHGTASSDKPDLPTIKCGNCFASDIEIVDLECKLVGTCPAPVPPPVQLWGETDDQD
jgi:hypothetical protein